MLTLTNLKSASKKNQIYLTSNMFSSIFKVNEVFFPKWKVKKMYFAMKTGRSCLSAAKNKTNVLFINTTRAVNFQDTQITQQTRAHF